MIGQLAVISPSLVSLNIPLRILASDLGGIINSELTFEQHCSKLSQTCFFHLRRLRAVRRSLTAPAMKTLVHAFVASRLDFCNAILVGCTATVLALEVGLECSGLSHNITDSEVQSCGSCNA